MSKIAVVAKITAQPGKRAVLVEEASKFIDHIEANEPGTEIYAVAEAADDDDVAYMIEVYTDQAAFEAHSTSDAMNEFIGNVASLLAGAPELTQTTLTRAKGIEL